MSQDASSSTAQATPRQEAGPLPTKQGEIGYSQDPDSPQTSSHNTEQVIPLPPRHPADRDAPSTPTPASPSPVDIPEPTPKGAPERRTWHGYYMNSLVFMLCLVLVIVGTIVSWIALAQAINHGQTALSGSGKTIVHVVFAFFVLILIIILERRLFYARAERFGVMHPDVVARSRPVSLAPSIVAPWNRPPLPSYAAALAQSGVGTGDVEDHLIAAQPPPAYGNTRGSTLLLSGFLRNSLRVQRPVSVHSSAERGERPLSYRSRDEEWEEVLNAHRAHELEETLERLQRPASAVTREPRY